MEEEEEEASLERFLKWATTSGVTDLPPSSESESESESESGLSSSCLGHSLSISYFPLHGGRGLAAARDLKKGELILRVPKPALMTMDSVVEKDQFFATALKEHPSLSSTQVLSVCLLSEMNKRQKSTWYPYLTQLPRNYDTLPSFGPFETKALQVNEAIWLAEKVISKAELDWKGAIPLLQQLNLKPQFLTFKAWLWSSATISTRTLHVPWYDAGCLCPVGDLFNYAAPGDESEEDQSSDGEQFSERLIDGGYEEDFGAYCYYAKRNYRKYEQVLLSYGTYTNLELLEHYGFLLNKNPNDKIFLPLGQDIHACHSWPSDSLHIQHDGTPSFALLSTLRLWATPPNQRKPITFLALSGSRLSSENEKKVLSWIKSSCEAVLRNLPSTVEDDLLVLSEIEKAQKVKSLEIADNVSSSVVAMEFRKFAQCVGFENGDSWMKVTRCMDKWKLAVQWRVRFKQTILDCISFCSRNNRNQQMLEIG